MHLRAVFLHSISARQYVYSGMNNTCAAMHTIQSRGVNSFGLASRCPGFNVNDQRNRK